MKAKGAFGWFRKNVTGGAPNTVLGRPVSRMVAPTLAVGAEIKLVATPLPNGDSWLGRLSTVIQSASQGDFSNVLGFDDAQNHSGNNILSIAALQIEQNAPGAVVLALESVILGAFGRAVGA